MLKWLARWALRKEIDALQSRLTTTTKDLHGVRRRLHELILSTHTLVTPNIEIYTSIQDTLDHPHYIHLDNPIIGITPDCIEWRRDIIDNCLDVCEFLVEKGYLKKRESLEMIND